MSIRSYSVGEIVLHPNKPNWGPGKILAVEENCLRIYFRDIPESNVGDAVKKINLDYVSLQIAPSQNDPQLDNLPPFKEGRLETTKPRLSLKQGIDAFIKQYPLGFNDPQYLGDEPEGERNYKWGAHLKWVELMGAGKAAELLAKDDIQELVRRLEQVEGMLNLLSPYEKMALRDALRNETLTRQYFKTLLDLLNAQEATEGSFTAYAEAVTSLPKEEGKARVATWPVLTLFPFISRPDRFMFLKPEATRGCAERLAFNLEYDAALNWKTYQKLLMMSDMLMNYLRPLGARDMIDVQSFIFLIAAWED